MNSLFPYFCPKCATFSPCTKYRCTLERECQLVHGGMDDAESLYRDG